MYRHHIGILAVTDVDDMPATPEGFEAIANAADEAMYEAIVSDLDTDPTIEFADAERDAREALNRGDMDAHMIAGRRYHTIADEIALATGIDPRPAELAA